METKTTKTTHLFRSRTALMALCGHIDRSPERPFPEWDGTPDGVCKDCLATSARTWG